jgi:5-formyltetrahydrofolate cyclo-ligase
MKKEELRKLYTEKRNVLTDTEIKQLSQEISNRVLQYFNLSQQTISLFLSIASKKEIETTTLLHKLLALQCKITISKSEFTTAEMTHFLYEDEQQIEISKYGIPEPKYGIEITPQEMDVVFVPLLGFDKEGYRIGYGKGFYDRFLSQCKKECVFIGLSFFDEVVEIDEVHSNDIPLHYCVTPKSVYSFQ